MSTAKMEDILDVNDASIHFGGLIALDSMTFKLRAGEVLGVIGPNGAGKSTLINAITGVYQLTSGKISFKDKRIDGLPEFKIARAGIVRTFQTSRLFNGLSVLDNVLIGMHKRMRGGIIDAVFRAPGVRRRMREHVERAAAIIHDVDARLDGRLYDLVENLPHADKRRVEIARALASEPQVLLLDEPAAGMGVADTRQFMDDMDSIRAMNRELAILIIEHDMDLMSQFPDRVLVMDHGQMIASGSFEEISEVEDVKTAYLGSAGGGRE